MNHGHAMGAKDMDNTKRSVMLGFPIVALLIAAALAGCAAGPDFKQPEAPKTDAYTSTVLPEETVSTPGRAGAAQRFATGGDIPAQWWTLFHSEALDRLIRQALADSPSLAASKV